MFVVINADDLGLHPAVERAVEALGRQGVLTSASLLANGPRVEAAARLTTVAMGVHLNILRGRPVLAAERVGSLVTPEGRFLGNYVALGRRAALRRLDLEQVEAEWAAQIERVCDLGVRPSHLDSEKHIHCWPRMMPIVCRLARRYNVRWVRRTVERGVPMGSGSALARVFLLRWWARSHEVAEGVRWPDAVWGIADQGARLCVARFVRYARGLPAGAVVEIVCHPGDPRPGDPPLPADYGPMRVADQWQAEFAALREGSWPAVVARCGGRLVSYRELAEVAGGGGEPSE